MKKIKEYIVKHIEPLIVIIALLLISFGCGWYSLGAGFIAAGLILLFDIYRPKK